jgi:hypothetical protein
MNTLESIAEQDAKRAIAINKPIFDLIEQIFNLPGSRVEGRHERVAPVLQQERRAVEADALTKSAGSKPASPTIQQPPLTAEEHNRFPLGRWATPINAAANLRDEEDCPHDEHDHGICLSCGKDITQDLVAKAEAASDAAQDR